MLFVIIVDLLTPGFWKYYIPHVTQYKHPK